MQLSDIRRTYVWNQGRAPKLSFWIGDISVICCPVSAPVFSDTEERDKDYGHHQFIKLLCHTLCECNSNSTVNRLFYLSLLVAISSLVSREPCDPVMKGRSYFRDVTVFLDDSSDLSSYEVPVISMISECSVLTIYFQFFSYSFSSPHRFISFCISVRILNDFSFHFNLIWFHSFCI